ncbi:hypothetical protein HIM_09624 [Hirsutella minnesotensis 3608]|uniref:pyruvate, water dikinase n=1 Tax=Hirsutella minnesotensis 3608 TaxID=1043627 RepID=A0A0F8A301_9HYPO|nr:hypothetical protein HIM_09624 [Hirsutella minnesotensis 3608]
MANVNKATDADDLTLVVSFEHLGRGDGALVGGKNSSLGEMISALGAKGIAVPPGFATTAQAYWQYVDCNGIRDEMAALVKEWQESKLTLAETGQGVRSLFLRGTWPSSAAAAIRAAYRQLLAKTGVEKLDVAVRSSATAEDLPDASFAGQQKTYLNISGEESLLDACRRCYASLFTDRAISYRQMRGFDHMSVALSIGAQQMARSDAGGSGVMFSIDTESGFDKVVLINAAWGLGENVVQGTVDPDEYQKRGAKDIKMVYGDQQTPTRNVPTSKAERDAYVLSDQEILQLARWACIIEEHYGCPMDMEWAKDGITGKLFIVQARPETVQSRRDTAVFKSYKIANKGPVLTTGHSVGDAAVSGRLCLVSSAKDMDKFVDNSILVTGATEPDWVPMKRATAIITDHGGRTSHAAIVSRELGLPAIVGTGNATYVLHSGQDVTVSCAEGDRVEDELRPLPWTVGVQAEADQLMRVVTKVIHDLTPRAQPPPYAKRWWTKDLTRLRRTYTYWRNQARTHRRASKSRPDLERHAKEAAKEYHDNIRKQKRAHWDDFVADETNIGRQLST